MWTVFLVGLLGILATICFGFNSHFGTLGYKERAYWFLVAAIVLYVLAALLLIIKFARWWFGVRYIRRPAKGSQPTPAKRIETRAFNVGWDSDLNPICLVCETPLILSIKKLAYRIDPLNNSIPPPAPVLRCVKCDENVHLYDDNGKYMELAEAKNLLLKPSSQPVKALPPPPHSNFEPDDTELEILKFLAIDNVDHSEHDLAESLALSVERVRYHLDRLRSNGFTRDERARIAYRTQPCLTQKGRTYLAERNLI